MTLMFFLFNSAPNSSPKDSSTMNSGTLQRKISSVSAQLSRQESSGSDSPRKMSTDSNFELMKTPSFGFSRGPSPLTLGKSVFFYDKIKIQAISVIKFEKEHCTVNIFGSKSGHF